MTRRGLRQEAARKTGGGPTTKLAEELRINAKSLRARAIEAKTAWRATKGLTKQLTKPKRNCSSRAPADCGEVDVGGGEAQIGGGVVVKEPSATSMTTWNASYEIERAGWYRRIKLDRSITQAALAIETGQTSAAIASSINRFEFHLRRSLGLPWKAPSEVPREHLEMIRGKVAAIESGGT
jgi:hypothetical protein